jgi:hypothetical protein
MDEAAMAFEQQRIGIEKEKLELERVKAQIEASKVQLERSKAVWAAVSVTVPILVAAATIAYGAWSLRKTAEAQFTARAVEIAWTNAGPREVANKMKALADLFGDLLPKELSARLQKFDPETYGVRDRTIEPKQELIKLLAERPSQRTQILRDWRTLLGKNDEDKWVSELSEH